MPGCRPNGSRERLPISKYGEVVNANVLGVGREDRRLCLCRTGMLVVLYDGHKLDRCDRANERTKEINIHLRPLELFAGVACRSGYTPRSGAVGPFSPIARTTQGWKGQ